MGQSQVSFRKELWVPNETEVVTRTGTPVRILSIINNPTYPVVGVILGQEKDTPAAWTESGMFQTYRTSHHDLFIKVKENV